MFVPLCSLPSPSDADDTRGTDLRAEEAEQVQQQGRSGGAVLPVVLLLVPREVRQVHQQECIHPGTGEIVTQRVVVFVENLSCVKSQIY